MKKSILLLAAIGVAFSVSAQNRISVSNYKMGREAAKAKATNADNIQFQAYKASQSSGLKSSANYKNTFVSENSEGGVLPFVIVESSNNAVANAANYKTQSGRSGARKKTIVVPAQPKNESDAVVRNNE